MASMPQHTSFITFEPEKRTLRAEFLDTMATIVPWSELVAVVASHYELAKTGRPLTDYEVRIRSMCLTVWFGRGDEMLKEDIHEMPVFLKFLGLVCDGARIPDHIVMCPFRNLLEAYGLTGVMPTRINTLLTQRGLLLMQGAAVDATIIDAPSVTRNANEESVPGCASTKKGANCRYGMKMHAGVDTDTRITHSLVFTPANEGAREHRPVRITQYTSKILQNAA